MRYMYTQTLQIRKLVKKLCVVGEPGCRPGAEV